MDYLERLLDARLAALLAEVPAVLLTGPRACGKTTTARRLARTVIQLDDPSVGPVFRTAPDVALRGLEPPVLLDEWQAAPEVVGAVKRAVDRDPAPGQFVLTGSAGTDLAGVTWPGTGRIIRLAMSALTERELAGRVAAPSFLDVVREAPESFAAASALDLGDYVNLALRGGFPEPALRLTDATRMDWLGSYLDECFSRDIPALRTVRDPARLRRLFEALAANTAGVVDEKTVHEAARLDRRTALAYEALFEAVGITEQVPSFAGNRLKRLIERPKRYVTDGGLVAAALALERSSILRDANMLGRLVDTFVLAQLRGELARSTATRARLHHLRSEGGRHEIDLVADLGPRGVVGIEVKAAGAPTAHDVRHLRWFLAEMTDRPTTAVVLHAGSRAYELDGGVLALPISCIWSP